MRRWRSYEEAYAELSELDPAERVDVLLIEFDNQALSLPTDEVRRLFVYAWGDGPPASMDRDHDVVRMLRWIAPVRDVESYLSGTVTLYRPADGSDVSIRWTIDEARAAAASSNGVLRTTIESSDVLAHLTAGGTDQVLVDPRDHSAVEPV
jgi:hypothetical protein